MKQEGYNEVEVVDTLIINDIARAKTELTCLQREVGLRRFGFFMIYVPRIRNAHVICQLGFRSYSRYSTIPLFSVVFSNRGFRHSATHAIELFLTPLQTHQTVGNSVWLVLAYSQFPTTPDFHLLEMTVSWNPAF